TVALTVDGDLAVKVTVQGQVTGAERVPGQARDAGAALVGHRDPDHRAQAGHLDREPATVTAGRVLDGVRAQLDRDRYQVVAGRSVRQQAGEPVPELAQLGLLTAEQALPVLPARARPAGPGPDPRPVRCVRRGPVCVNHLSPLTASTG